MLIKNKNEMKVPFNNRLKQNGEKKEEVKPQEESAKYTVESITVNNESKEDQDERKE